MSGPSTFGEAKPLLTSQSRRLKLLSEAGEEDRHLTLSLLGVHPLSQRKSAVAQSVTTEGDQQTLPDRLDRKTVGPHSVRIALLRDNAQIEHQGTSSTSSRSCDGTPEGLRQKRLHLLCDGLQDPQLNTERRPKVR